MAGGEAHVSEHAIRHVSSDLIAQRSVAIHVARQHRFDLAATDAGRDEEIEKLGEPDLAPVLLVEREQPPTITTQSSQPTGSIVT